MPVHRERLGQLVVHEEAHTVPFRDLDRGTRHVPVEAPGIDMATWQKLRLHRFGHEMKLLHPADHRHGIRGTSGVTTRGCAPSARACGGIGTRRRRMLVSLRDGARGSGGAGDGQQAAQELTTMRVHGQALLTGETRSLPADRSGPQDRSGGSRRGREGTSRSAGREGGARREGCPMSHRARDAVADATGGRQRPWPGPPPAWPVSPR